MAFDTAFVDVTSDLWLDPHAVLGARVHMPHGLYEDKETPFHIQVLVFGVGWLRVDAQAEESEARRRVREILMQVYNARD
jgi:hypothetical protein